MSPREELRRKREPEFLRRHPELMPETATQLRAVRRARRREITRKLTAVWRSRMRAARVIADSCIAGTTG